MNTKTLVAILVALMVLGAGVVAANWYSPGSIYLSQQTTSANTSTNIVASPADTSVLAYGKVTLRLGQSAIFKDISIRPVAIEEDSRCPVDVQCIQAGTVRVRVEMTSSMGTSSTILKLNEMLTTEGEAITLTDVTPAKVSTTTVSAGDYLLTFSVVART